MNKGLTRSVKYSLILLGFVLFLYLLVFRTPLFLADIRPEMMKEGYHPLDNGFSYMSKFQQAHGIEEWSKKDSIQYQVEQAFGGNRIRILVSPTGEEAIQYLFTSYPNHVHNSNYKSTGGNDFYIGKDEAGIYQIRDGQKKYGGFKASFFYSAIQHLIEFPFQMESITIAEYIGEESWGGNDYDLVFATWHKLEPNHDFDQYIIWMNKNTGLIDRFDATGRQILPFARATAVFTYDNGDERIKIPTKVKVFRNSPQGSLIMDLDIEISE